MEKSSLAMSMQAIRAACDRVAQQIQAEEKYAHTSHLAVQIAGSLIYDTHFTGPELADVYSVTKTVLATLVGVAQRERRMPPLDDPVSDVLSELRGTPAAAHTWRHLLTMTRGSQTDGPWDIDEIVALPSDQVGHIAQAPQLTPSGAVFGYDNASAHLISAGLEAVVGSAVAKYAERVLFGPLGIEDYEWLADRAGVSFGHAHLKLRGHDLLKLGTLWLNGGVWNGESLVDPRYLRDMTTAQASGGPPEFLEYGYLTWIGHGHYLASGWAGQHVLVSPPHQAIVVLTGDPQFSFGPPPSDALPSGWMSALHLVNHHLLPTFDEPSGGT
ncbi:MAG TPA: serine hydrolase [Propionibacteriaceae bacterium]|jgi:CubicO group peptidase (beta-lactamase class C family)|nr:serine hydrolase [Propionibacteriaceae bacterium]